MNHKISIEQIRDPIPASPSDDLLRLWGYDLVSEYVQILHTARLDTEQPVLELATGTGRMAALLTRLGFRVLTGDLTDEEHARANARVTPAYADKVQHLRLDMRNLPFGDQSVSTIVCLNTLHELDDPRTCLSELIRIHDPGGTLVIGDFSEIGFAVMQRLHRAVHGDDHRSGCLRITEAKPLLAEVFPVIREVVTPLNISYIVCCT